MAQNWKYLSKLAKGLIEEIKEAPNGYERPDKLIEALEKYQEKIGGLNRPVNMYEDLMIIINNSYKSKEITKDLSTKLKNICNLAAPYILINDANSIKLLIEIESLAEQNSGWPKGRVRFLKSPHLKSFIGHLHELSKLLIENKVTQPKEILLNIKSYIQQVFDLMEDKIPEEFKQDYHDILEQFEKVILKEASQSDTYKAQKFLEAAYENIDSTVANALSSYTNVGIQDALNEVMDNLNQVKQHLHTSEDLYPTERKVVSLSSYLENFKERLPEKIYLELMVPCDRAYLEVSGMVRKDAIRASRKATTPEGLEKLRTEYETAKGTLREEGAKDKYMLMQKRAKAKERLNRLVKINKGGEKTNTEIAEQRPITSTSSSSYSQSKQRRRGFQRRGARQFSAEEQMKSKKGVTFKDEAELEHESNTSAQLATPRRKLEKQQRGRSLASITAKYQTEKQVDGIKRFLQKNHQDFVQDIDYTGEVLTIVGATPVSLDNSQDNSSTNEFNDLKSIFDNNNIHYDVSINTVKSGPNEVKIVIQGAEVGKVHKAFEDIDLNPKPAPRDI